MKGIITIITAQNAQLMVCGDGSKNPFAPIGSAVLDLGNGEYMVMTPNGNVTTTAANPIMQ